MDISIILIALLMPYSVSFAYYIYENELAEDHCGNVTYNLGKLGKRAGTLRLHEAPVEQICSFDVSVDATVFGGSPVAIYINVRTLELYSTESISIYEKSTNGGLHLVKRLNINTTGYWAVPSWGQLKTAFAQNPALHFSFNLSEYRNGWRDIRFDWTIIREYVVSGLTASKCRALDGYIPDEILCEYGDTDRVSCPTSYFSSIGSNPAPSRYLLPRAHCFSGNYITFATDDYTTGSTPSYWNTSYDESASMSAFAVAAIVMSCLIGATAVIFGLLRVCYVFRPSAIRTTFNQATHSGPVIVTGTPQGQGSYPMYTIATTAGTTIVSDNDLNSNQFLGAPPAYSSMFPADSAATTTHPPAPPKH